MTLTDIEEIHYNNLQNLLLHSEMFTTDMQHALVFALECIEELRQKEGGCIKDCDDCPDTYTCSESYK